MTQRDFEALAMQLRTKALGITLRMLHSRDDAEDTASDVMLRLWSLHERLKDERHALNLSMVIARNLCIDALRKARRTPPNVEGSLLSEHLLVQGALPSEKMEYEEEERWLLRQMEKLPPRELQVLRMRHTELLSNEEIASLLGLGESSVKVMLSNARKKLFNDIKRRNRQ